MCYSLKFVFRTYVIVLRIDSKLSQITILQDSSISWDKLQTNILNAHILYSPPLESIRPPINSQIVSLKYLKSPQKNSQFIYIVILVFPNCINKRSWFINVQLWIKNPTFIQMKINYKLIQHQLNGHINWLAERM